MRSKINIYIKTQLLAMVSFCFVINIQHTQAKELLNYLPQDTISAIDMMGDIDDSDFEVPEWNTNDEEIRCTLYLNNADVTACNCVDIENTQKRFDCVREKQMELYRFICDNSDNSDNTNYKKWLNNQMSDLGYKDWADAELAYIASLQYESDSIMQIRKILYTQNVMQQAFSMFNNQGIFVGGPYDLYYKKIQKYRPDLLTDIDTTDVDDPSVETSQATQKALTIVLNELVESIDNSLLTSAHEKWQSLIDNNFNSGYEQFDDVPENMIIDTFVLQPLFNRINLMEEYTDRRSKFTINRLLHGFTIAPIELYELLTHKEMDTDEYIDED